MEIESLSAFWKKVSWADCIRKGGRAAHAKVGRERPVQTPTRYLSFATLTRNISSPALTYRWQYNHILHCPHKETKVVTNHTAQQVLPSFILTTWWSTHTFSPSDLWLEAGCTVNQQLSFMAPAHGNTIWHMHYMAATILLWPTLVWLVCEANIISQFVRGGRGWETTKQLQESMQTVSML